jgi:hypothetical protein
VAGQPAAPSSEDLRQPSLREAKHGGRGSASGLTKEWTLVSTKSWIDRDVHAYGGDPRIVPPVRVAPGVTVGVALRS